MTNISCIVNAHQEGDLIITTLLSVSRAQRYAKKRGITTSLTITLDNADSKTKNAILNNTTTGTRIIETSHGDPGLSRNTAILETDSEYIALLDGDDLWSRNWLAESYLMARAQQRDVILHPQFNIMFGNGKEQIIQHEDTDNQHFNDYHLLDHNYWTALSFAKTELYRDTPFLAADKKAGFSYEDWTWNWQTLQKNIQHKSVHNTAHFIRKTKNSPSRLASDSRHFHLPKIYDSYTKTAKQNSHRNKFTQNTNSKKTILQTNSSIPSPNSTKISSGFSEIHKYLDVFLTIFECKLLCDFESPPPSDTTITLIVNHKHHNKHSLAEIELHNRDSRVQSYSINIQHLAPLDVNFISVKINSTHKQYIHKQFFYCPLIETYRTTISLLFYSDLYITSHQNEKLRTEQDALDHFFTYGIYKDHIPNPWFDPVYYREQNPDRLACVNNPLLAYLHFEHEDNSNPNRYFDIRQYRNYYRLTNCSPLVHYANIGKRYGYCANIFTLPESINEEVQQLSAIESSLDIAKYTNIAIKEYSRTDRLSHYVMYLHQRYSTSVKCLICIGSPSTLAETCIDIIHFYQRHYGKSSVLICITDSHTDTIINGLDPETEITTLFRQNINPKPIFQRKVRTLHNVVATLRPAMVLNIGSSVTWSMFSNWGAQLSSATRLVSDSRSLEKKDSNIVGGIDMNYLRKFVHIL